MPKCPFFVRGALVLAAFVSGFAWSLPAEAADVSIPYRGMPGFTCHRWNAWGECAEFSYTNVPTRAYAPAPAYYRVPSVQRCTPYVDCTGTVNVRAQGMPNPVGNGEVITYTIYIRNDDSQTRVVDAMAYLDENVTYLRATYGGRSDGRSTVLWNDLTMLPYTSRTLTVQARVRRDASLTHALNFVVTAGRGGDTVRTAVQDSGIYRRPIIISEDTTYSPYGVPTGRPKLGYRYDDDRYWIDEYGRMRWR